MTNQINRQQVPQPIQNVNKSKRTKIQTPQTDRRFQSFVDEALKTNKVENPIVFSNHAQKRLEQRGIELDSEDLSKLDSAFESLNQKGSTNSLIIYDDLSLIASIKNRTIITASKTEEMTEVTNIDSAIHIKK